MPVHLKPRGWFLVEYFISQYKEHRLIDFAVLNKEAHSISEIDEAASLQRMVHRCRLAAFTAVVNLESRHVLLVRLESYVVT